jgi:ADP-heptose:LPS heptosyltransferase
MSSFITRLLNIRRFIIDIDGGCMHIAEALNAKPIILFGPYQCGQYGG